MNCREIRFLIEDILDESVTGTQRHDVGFHLQRCADCRDFVEAEKRERLIWSQRLNERDSADPVLDTGRLSERLVGGCRRAAKAKRRKSFWLKSGLAAAVAFCVAYAVLVYRSDFAKSVCSATRSEALKEIDVHDLSAEVGPFAADFQCALGESKILRSGTYGTVFVNGVVAVPADSTVVCDSLTVASGNVEHVEFTVGPRSKLVVRGVARTMIGVDGGAGVFTLGEGAVLEANGKVCVSSRTSATGFSQNPFVVNLRPGARMSGVGRETRFSIHGGLFLPKAARKLGVMTTVNLDARATLNFSTVEVRSRPDVRINFNGGCISNQWNTGLMAMVFNRSAYRPDCDHGAKLYLTSVNGHPVHLFKAAHAHCFIAQRPNGQTFVEGDMVLDGIRDNRPQDQNGFCGISPSRLHFVALDEDQRATLTFKGDVHPRLLPDRDKKADANRALDGLNLVIGPRARLDLNGQRLELPEVDGYSRVVDSVEEAMSWEERLESRSVLSLQGRLYVGGREEDIYLE